MLYIKSSTSKRLSIMIDLEKATTLALEFLEKKSDAIGYELALMDNTPIKIGTGWVFHYESKLFLETQKKIYRAHSALPIVVDINTEALEYYSEVYKKRMNGLLPQFYDLDFFFKFYIAAESVKPNDDCAASKHYASEVMPIGVKRVIKQAQLKLAENPFDYQNINHSTNRYFDNQEEAKKWLTKIIKCLADTQI